MRVGVGLPTNLGAPPDPELVLGWARRADETGFAALAVHDRPNHWTWEPLVALAAAAAVTRRIRLMTSAVLLPTRSERLLAKQAAVVDQLSRGRLDLGVAIGARPTDYEALSAPFARRGRRFEAQLETMIGVWTASAEGEGENERLGPAPVQSPHPPLWIGGYKPAAVKRAVRFGAGYLFGASGVEAMRQQIPEIREAARAAGRRELQIGGLAYVAYDVGALTAERAEKELARYYGTLRRPFEELVHLGDGDELATQLDAYRDAGLDLLLLLPTIPELEQLERLATDVLPRVQRRE